MSRAERAARPTAPSRRRARTLAGATVAVVVVTVLTAVATPASARATDGASRTAEICTSEEYRWSGSLSLAVSGAAASTGVDVPTVPGTWLRASGISADGLDAAGFVHAVAVTVGTATVTVGATVAGGVLGVRSLDDAAVTVSGVTLVVDRCREVASAGPPPASPAAPATTTAPAAPGITTTGASVTDLPHTGGRVGTTSLAAALALVAGVALLAIARRRHC